MQAGNEYDKVVISQILNGDIDKFKHLVNKYQRQVYGIILKFSSNSDIASELTQEVFIKAYESLSNYNDDYKFFSWIYRIAINHTLLFKKRSKKFEDIDSVKELKIETENDTENEEEKSRLLNMAIGKLNDKYKKVVLLKYFAKLSYSEIAETIEIPEKKVKSRLFDARKLLKDQLVKMNFFEQIQNSNDLHYHAETN